MKRVEDVMTRNIYTVDVDETIDRAATLMRDGGVGMIVVTEDDKAVGVLTDRDIATRATSVGVPPRSTKVWQVATLEIITVRPEASLATAEVLMQTNMVRRLVAVNEQRHPVGVLTLDGLAAAAQSDAEIGQLLERLVHPVSHA